MINSFKVPEGMKLVAKVKKKYRNNYIFIFLHKQNEVLNIDKYLTDELEELEIYNVKTIERTKYCICPNVKKIVFSPDIKWNGVFDFSNWSRLKEIVIPKNIKTITEGMFWGCKSLKTIDIPEGVFKIGRGAFSGCISLSKISLPESLRIIEDSAFYNCKSLNSLIMGDNVKYIGEYCFADCIGLKKIRFSENLENIESATFYGCVKLTKVNIPNSVKKIGELCFSNCSNLRNIKLPNDITEIKKGMFIWCKNLNKIIIPENVELIGESVFEGCESLQTIKMGKAVKIIGEKAFSGCNKLNNLVLPMGLKNIEEKAFCGCESLEEIDIPDTVCQLGKSAFYNCISLKHVDLSQRLLFIPQECFCSCKQLEKVVIPENVFEIENGAFKKCFSLKTLCLGNGLEKIGDYAFTQCYNLIDIKIPRSLNEIGKFCFTSCLNLREIIIPDCITNIQKGAFFQCENLKKIKFEGDVKNLNTLCIPTLTKVITPEETYYGGFYGNCFTGEKLQSKFFDALIKKIDRNKIAKGDWEFFKFAYNIGCFSRDPFISQRSCVWIEEKLKQDKFSGDECLREFGEWAFVKKENKEFIDFLFSYVPDEKRTLNIDELLNNEDFGYLTNKILKEFENQSSEEKNGRFRNLNGELMFVFAIEKNTKLGVKSLVTREYKPSIKAFKKYFAEVSYENIETEEDLLLSEELCKHKGIKQSIYDNAKMILKEFYDNKVSPNIVGKHLKSEFKQDNNGLIKNNESIMDNKNLLNNVQNHFTYEWLEKNDPMNFVLGLYCDCCASLLDCGYGIVHAGIVHPDIQNLVVKDVKGQPVAKGTFYVNRKKGYGVFNTIKVSHKKTDEEKDEIYKTFMCGVKDFVKEYNKNNPKQKIDKISTGIFVNDLEEQILTKSKNRDDLYDDNILTGVDFSLYGIPSKDYKGDWNKEYQVVIWKDSERTK